MSLLTVKNLSLIAANKKRLDNVSFQIAKPANTAKKVALVGLNGAGKSTLIELLTGQLQPSHGEIYFSSLAPCQPAFKNQLGFQAAAASAIPGVTVAEYFHLCCQLKSSLQKNAKTLIQKIVKDWQLENILSRPMHKLSQGNLQKVRVAQAFLGLPRIIILDEPTQAFDPIEQQRFHNNLAQLDSQQCCLFSSHHISETVETADQVLLLHHGQFIALLDLKQPNEFWFVTQLEPGKIKMHLSAEHLEKCFSRKNNLYKITKLDGSGYTELMQKLFVEDSNLLQLDNAKQALMPLFSLLANEGL